MSRSPRLAGARSVKDPSLNPHLHPETDELQGRYLQSLSSFPLHSPVERRAGIQQMAYAVLIQYAHFGLFPHDLGAKMWMATGQC